MSEYAPDQALVEEVFGLARLGHLGELEEKLWTMDLKHLTFFAGSDTTPGPEASRILEVRVARETAESIRKTNRYLVLATWSLVVVTAVLALTS